MLFLALKSTKKYQKTEKEHLKAQSQIVTTLNKKLRPTSAACSYHFVNFIESAFAQNNYTISIKNIFTKSLKQETALLKLDSAI
jgi:hypothetical protein